MRACMCAACVLACAQADAHKEFDAIDVKRGGQVLFDEFCALGGAQARAAARCEGR